MAAAVAMEEVITIIISDPFSYLEHSIFMYNKLFIIVNC